MIWVNFIHLKILKGLFVLHVHFTGRRHWPWPIVSMIPTIYAQYVPRHLAASQQLHANTLESGLQKLCTQLLQIEGSLRDGTHSTHRIRCRNWYMYHISVPGAPLWCVVFVQVGAEALISGAAVFFIILIFRPVGGERGCNLRADSTCSAPCGAYLLTFS